MLIADDAPRFTMMMRHCNALMRDTRAQHRSMRRAMMLIRAADMPFDDYAAMLPMLPLMLRRCLFSLRLFAMLASRYAYYHAAADDDAAAATRWRCAATCHAFAAAAIRCLMPLSPILPLAFS